MQSQQYEDPKHDPRSMRNMVDVSVTLKGLSYEKAADRREAARKMIHHCAKGGLSASEVEAFREMGIGLLDFRPEDPETDKKKDVVYTYRTDAGTLKMNPIAGATACLPEGVTADICIAKNGSEVALQEDPTNFGYWNCVLMEASHGNFTRQALGHLETGQTEPSALNEIREGNFCDTFEQLGYMAMSFSAQEKARQRQAMREKDADEMTKQEEELEAE